MSRVLTFSRQFPGYHPRKGEPTYFVEQLLNSLGVKSKSELLPGVHEIINDFCMLDNDLAKHHTIRSGNRWEVGDTFSPRVWSGKPYRSKQIIIAPDIEVVQVWDFKINGGRFMIDNRTYHGETEGDFEMLDKIALNDGLTRHDLAEWFQLPKEFSGQIICWNKNIKY